MEEINAEIKALDEKIVHAKQAVLIAKSSNDRAVKFKPEWVAVILLLILFADMLRMMRSGNIKLSIWAIIGFSAVILIYGIYLMTVFIPNARDKKASEEIFAERNAILETLLLKRKKLFEDFAEKQGGKVYRSISLERDIALWRNGGELNIASLSDGIKIEITAIDQVRYISTDRLLHEYNRRIANYKITSYNAVKNADTEKIYYSYIFFDNGGNLILPDEAYPYLKEIMPEKELASLLENNKATGGLNT